MKKTLFFLLFAYSGAMAQNKKDSIYKLESIPTYDQDGNMTTTVQEFDHVPTAEDSAAFVKKCGCYIFTNEAKAESMKQLGDFIKEYNMKNPPDVNKKQKKTTQGKKPVKRS